MHARILDEEVLIYYEEVNLFPTGLRRTVGAVGTGCSVSFVVPIILRRSQMLKSVLVVEVGMRDGPICCVSPVSVTVSR